MKRSQIAIKKANVKIGDRFGRLVVLERIGTHIFPNKSKTPIWRCLCDCGNYYNVISASLISGNTKSCGCLQEESRIKHNLYVDNKKMYHVWSTMKQRCNNPNDKNYHNYGGRGIKVCNEWLKDFSNFYNWAISNGYQEGLSIERKDVNGDYCPENCCWITMKEQQSNKRDSKKFEYDGKNLTLLEWSKLLNISPDTLASRYYTRHWTIEKTLTTPVHTTSRNKKAKTQNREVVE